MLAAGPGDQRGRGVPRGGQGHPEGVGRQRQIYQFRIRIRFQDVVLCHLDGVGVRGLPTAQWRNETVVVSVAVVGGVVAMVLLPHFHNSGERRKQQYNVT